MNRILSVAQGHLNRIVTPFDQPRVRRASGVETQVVDNIVAGAMLMTEGDKQTRKKPQEAVRQILTDTDTRSLGIEGLGVQLRELHTENRKLREALEAMQKNPVLQVGNDIEQLRRQLSESRKQMAELDGMVEAMRRKADRRQGSRVSVFGGWICTHCRACLESQNGEGRPSCN